MLDEFYAKKPELTCKQINLLNAFHNISKERDYEQSSPLVIKEKDIRYYLQYNDSCSLPNDLFIECISLIDNEYLRLKYEEIQRKIKKA